MKPRCPSHNRPLSWHRAWKRWYCRGNTSWQWHVMPKGELAEPRTKAKLRPQRRVMKDGRTILSGAAYSALKREVLVRQSYLCVALVKSRIREGMTMCGRQITQSTSELHHTTGRGMAGGKRSDRPEDCECLCISCHRRKCPGWINREDDKMQKYIEEQQRIAKDAERFERDRDTGTGQDGYHRFLAKVFPWPKQIGNAFAGLVKVRSKFIRPVINFIER